MHIHTHTYTRACPRAHTHTHTHTMFKHTDMHAYSQACLHRSIPGTHTHVHTLREDRNRSYLISFTERERKKRSPTVTERLSFLLSEDGTVVLGKTHSRSAPSLGSLPKVAFESVLIGLFVWLNTDRSRPWRVECRPLPFSTPLSFG